MRLLVRRNRNGEAIPSHANGPEVGHVFPYCTIAGIPVGFEESVANTPDLEGAAIGMVVVHVRTGQLYSINVDGDAVPIGMTVPDSCKDGGRLGAKLEADEKAYRAALSERLKEIRDHG